MLCLHTEQLLPLYEAQCSQRFSPSALGILARIDYWPQSPIFGGRTDALHPTGGDTDGLFARESGLWQTHVGLEESITIPIRKIAYDIARGHELCLAGRGEKIAGGLPGLESYPSEDTVSYRHCS